MSLGYVDDMDKSSKRFLTEGDPTIESGITGLQSSKFASLTVVVFSGVASFQLVRFGPSGKL